MSTDSQQKTSSAAISFRPATTDDIKAIMEIERESFVPGLQEDEPLYLKRIAVFADGFLVAEDVITGEIGGYISSELWHEHQNINADVLALGHNPEDLHYHLGTQLYITSFGTRQSWRGLKIGTALFNALETRIEKLYPLVTKKVLIVSEKWLAAQHIYAKKGFKETGRIIDFFIPDETPPEDAIIMMK